VKRAAIDLDGMFILYPDIFEVFIPAVQAKGVEVGILTARPDKEKDEFVKAFDKVGLKFDFILFKPEALEHISNGAWKAVMCRALKIDYLFDDLQHDDPQFVSDFTEVVAGTTVPFTTFTYSGTNDHVNQLKDDVEEIIEHLKK
jgi:hypothetical protein